MMKIMESNRHEKLKTEVQNRLEADGWETETEVHFPRNTPFHQRDVIVDVVGERDGETIAVEVGDLINRSVEDISEYVDDVVHIPYENSKLMGIEPDLHQVVRLYSRLEDDTGTLKEIVSVAVLNHLEENSTENTVDFCLDRTGYDSIEELEAVVRNDDIPHTTLELVDEMLPP